MNCEGLGDLYSARFDGELSAADRRAFDAHLDGCAGCRKDYAAFRYAVEDLRSLEVAPTPAADVAAVMAAVDAEAHSRVRSGERGERGDRRARSASGPSRSRMLVAALGGAAAMGLLTLAFGAWRPVETSNLQLTDGSGAPDLKPRTVEVWVPRDRIVEVPVVQRVEVPVVEERVVRVAVPVVEERVVEVPVPVIEERVVQVENPLQLELERAAAFGQVALGALAVARARLDEREAEAPHAPRPDSGPEPSRDEVRVASAERRDAPVRLRREDGFLSLTTRGSTDEIVPALIAMLQDPDPAVVATVEGKLFELRRRLDGPAAAEPVRGTPGGVGTQLKSVFRGGPFAIVSEPELSPAERWQAWWSDRSAR